jgi:CHAT domain-containing protein
VLEGQTPAAVIDPDPQLNALSAAAIKTLAQGHHVTLLSYYPLAGGVAAWRISPEGRIDGRILPLPADRLDALVRATLEALNPAGAEARAGRPPRPGRVPSDLKGLLTELHRALIDPVASWLPPEPERVAVITRGLLAAVPFGALMDKEGHLLVQRHPVVAVPSASLLTALKPSKVVMRAGEAELYLVGEGTRAGIAPPDERLDTLQQALLGGPFKAAPDALQVLTGAQATEEGLEQLLGRPTMVQVVSRSFYHLAHPWLSGLLLSRAGETPADDGVLTVAELPWGRLQARLVVLPPFDGPEAARTRLEGVELGMLSAGVHSVLVPLGSAGLSEDLAARFYQALEQGQGPLEALRTAQVGALQDGAELRRVAGLTLAGVL